MIAVALWVASLPGAVGRMPAFGIGPLLLGSAGLVRARACCDRRCAGAAWRCWSSRASGRSRTPQPDVLIAGRRPTRRGARRRRPACRSCARGSDTFAVARVARRRCRCARAERRRRSATGITLRRCRLRRPACRRRAGRLARSIEAFEEDCRARRAGRQPARRRRRLRGAGDRPQRAARGPARSRCAGSGEGFAIVGGHGRRATTGRGRGATPTVRRRVQPPPAATHAPPRDATPRPEDLEPGD